MQNEHTRRFGCSKRPHVALLVASSDRHAWGVLSGILRYKRKSGLWFTSLCNTDLGTDISGWLNEWHGDGIIALSDDHDLICHLKALKTPTVHVRSAAHSQGLPNVGHDHIRVSQYCFAHLRQCGFTDFAFYGRNRGEGYAARRESFERIVKNAGFSCFTYSRKHQTRNFSTKQYDGLGLKDEGQVAEWIKRLPKPIGVMACDDRHAQHILDASRALGLVSPKEIAAIGVGNDELFCNFCHPPLTSVVTNDGQVGLEAARLLSDMMSGKIRSRRKIVVEPAGIVIRSSTRWPPVNGCESDTSICSESGYPLGYERAAADNDSACNQNFYGSRWQNIDSY
jgi:LacI family transcriptional regulator